MRVARGLPELPLPPYQPSMKPAAVLLRRRRDMARRMAAYDGVPYDDRMASSPRVRAALEP